MELALPVGFDSAPTGPIFDRVLAADTALERQVTAWHWQHGSDEVALIAVVERPRMAVPHALASAAALAHIELLGRSAEFVSERTIDASECVVDLRGPANFERARVVVFARPNAVWRITVIAASEDPATVSAICEALTIGEL